MSFNWISRETLVASGVYSSCGVIGAMDQKTIRTTKIFNTATQTLRDNSGVTMM